MKSLIGALLVVIVLMPVGAQAAAITTGSKVTVTGSTGSLGGGPFTIRGGDVDFLTFCIEINEHIAIGKSYFVNFAFEARGGGLGGGNPDPLDSQTAYLYSRFANNSLNGYDAAKAEDRDGLQLAIWHLENEVEKRGGTYYKWKTSTVIGYSAAYARADHFLNLASNANGSLYGVRVMQLWDNYNPLTGQFSGKRQDQIIRVPDGTSTLTALLLGLAFIIFVKTRNGAA